MTLYEYRLRMLAYKLKQVDRDYDIHLQAWANCRVQDKKKQGKKTVSVYKTFRQFFNYEANLARVLGEKEKETSVGMKLSRIMKKQRGGKDGKL